MIIVNYRKVDCIGFWRSREIRFREEGRLVFDRRCKSFLYYLRKIYFISIKVGRFINKKGIMLREFCVMVFILVMKYCIKYNFLLRRGVKRKLEKE